MNPYVELQKIFNPVQNTKKFGKVVYADMSKIHVVVDGHPKIYDRPEGPYAKGDEIVVQGDVLIGKKKASLGIPVYSV